MKKLINKFLISISILFFVQSCDEYVDYEASENYQIIADDYFKSANDYEAALVGVYDVLQWTLYNFMIGEIASDNSLCGGESASDVIGLQKIDYMIHDPVNDQLKRIWQYMYEGVNRANYLVENKDKIVFPGVGAIKDCMAALSLDLRETVLEQIKNKPTLAICVGMQMLLESSEENDGVEGLNILKGKIT